MPECPRENLACIYPFIHRGYAVTRHIIHTYMRIQCIHSRLQFVLLACPNYVTYPTFVCVHCMVPNKEGGRVS